MKCDHKLDGIITFKHPLPLATMFKSIILKKQIKLDSS